MSDAAAQYKAGRVREAQAEARKQIAAGADVRRNLMVLAWAARDAGDFDLAVDLAAQACAADPQQTGPAVLLAELLRRRGRAVEAVEVLEQARLRCGPSADLLNHLGLAQRAALRPDSALASFRDAAALDPQNPWAFTNLAFSMLRDPSTQLRGQSFAALCRPDDPPTAGLGLFCDRFPHTYGFLLQQFTDYLRAFPDCVAYSYGRRVFDPYDCGQFGAAMQNFAPGRQDVLDRCLQLVPQLVEKPFHTRVVCRGGPFRKPRLAHCIFAMNADLFRPMFEALNIPFSFTLNPGGHFRLNDPHSDDRLRRVFRSPLFRKVVVTYAVTRDYIRERFNVPDEKIAFIPGTVLMESVFDVHSGKKRRFGIDKDSLDVCFVGMRYSPLGIDKGYDCFVAAAHILARRFYNLRFHVVGNFDQSVLDVSDLGGRMVFYGPRSQEWLAQFYAGMDVIASANRADQLMKGAFDGFPVTSCIEAGFCGVAVVASDPLGLNMWLRDGVDFMRIAPCAEDLTAALHTLLSDPAALYRMGENGAACFRRYWGEQAQMGPRLRLMQDLAAAEI